MTERSSLRLFLLMACLAATFWTSPATAQDEAAAPQPAAGPAMHNPILPGDHPDPTIIRIGHTYWTTSTSGGWAPEFVLYRSTDLAHWTAAGAVFPHTPHWARGDFWAPEMVSDNGRIVVYYAARKRHGPLCVAAATADQPAGPYTDHGPIVCQTDGSIDPSMVRDHKGRPYLIWKEDGNSIGQPTIIWAQRLTDDLLHVTGHRKKLLVNDPDSWEGAVVEAPYIMRHDGHFYLFYAGNACCGGGCHYAEGVARAKNVLGPWIKDPDNPIIRPNGLWRCPGHGTAVETPDGSDYFLYHAYPVSGSVYLGRESVLDRITWSATGWPVVNNGNGPSGQEANDPVAQPSFIDNFERHTLSPEWKWPIGHHPHWTLQDGGLNLSAAGDDKPALLARPLLAPDYVATAAIDAASSTASTGIGVISQPDRQAALSLHGTTLQLSTWKGSQQNTLWTGDIPANTSIVWLRVASQNAHQATFSYSLDNKHWLPAGPSRDVTELLAWDQGLRIALISRGAKGKIARFSQFQLEPQPQP